MPKFARYHAHGEIAYGVVEGNVVKQIKGSIFGKYEVTDHTHTLADVKLLAPCTPGKILAVGLNYKSHLGERDPMKEPLIFYKLPSSVVGPNEAIILPKSFTGRVDEEGELVAVIKDRCKHVSKEDSLNHVLGYTCGNDVSAREWQRGDGQWWRAKASDTFSALGPYIATGLDPNNLNLKARVNGNVVQEESTKMFLFNLQEVIAHVTKSITLEPGDVIYTGTPGKTAQLHEGDVVEVEVEGVGVLRNPVKNES
jgi:2-keto-4-pentenoate hydratase/2-oxohepta-3-ene-1,7-dioic acid hydratase in catechol pathway